MSEIDLRSCEHDWLCRPSTFPKTRPCNVLRQNAERLRKARQRVIERRYLEGYSKDGEEEIQTDCSSTKNMVHSLVDQDKETEVELLKYKESIERCGRGEISSFVQTSFAQLLNGVHRTSPLQCVGFLFQTLEPSKAIALFDALAEDVRTRNLDLARKECLPSTVNEPLSEVARKGKPSVNPLEEASFSEIASLDLPLCIRPVLLLWKVAHDERTLKLSRALAEKHRVHKTKAPEIIGTSPLELVREKNEQELCKNGQTSKCAAKCGCGHLHSGQCCTRDTHAPVEGADRYSDIKSNIHFGPLLQGDIDMKAAVRVRLVRNILRDRSFCRLITSCLSWRALESLNAPETLAFAFGEPLLRRPLRETLNKDLRSLSALSAVELPDTLRERLVAAVLHDPLVRRQVLARSTLEDALALPSPLQAQAVNLLVRINGLSASTEGKGTFDNCINGSAVPRLPQLRLLRHTVQRDWKELAATLSLEALAQGSLPEELSLFLIPRMLQTQGTRLLEGVDPRKIASLTLPYLARVRLIKVLSQVHGSSDKLTETAVYGKGQLDIHGINSVSNEGCGSRSNIGFTGEQLRRLYLTAAI